MYCFFTFVSHFPLSVAYLYLKPSIYCIIFALIALYASSQPLSLSLPVIESLFPLLHYLT